ncbi:PITH domain-containing protein [Phakopsora pachyrhizi]|uniref:PITH domain-domain-containing protein n=1 Tax=Phakopsora pachyrhizi TaxID=170000 RepID=A0AAV0BLE8_PHAPC|nr:PITH domain-containing protein [Phakopsora pachyrhizi]CAH7688072.1 PITH domain-domain-containing protein [Phakopsora pachyrhizi]
MSHNNNHQSCSHEAGDSNHHHHHHDDDDHVRPGEGTQDFLYSKIDRDNVIGLNVEPNHQAKDCIKPWSESNDDSKFTESDVDEQMIIQIPFTGSVKLRSILIRSLPDQFRPLRAKLFVNESNLDFDSIESIKPTQTLEIPETNELIEFPVRVAKFSSVTKLSIFFDGQQSSQKTKVYFLGFKGEFTQISRKPVIALYEAQANPSDHQKVNGLDNSNSINPSA